MTLSNHKNLFVGLSGMKNLALVQYVFSEDEHEVTVQKYGRAKEDKPYFRTFPSTVEKLKGFCKENKPKSAIQFTSDASGGVCKVEGSGSLPRNRRQASYCRKVLQNSRNSTSDKNDDLYRVILMCKEKNLSLYVMLIVHPRYLVFCMKIGS